jgi:hypothetical protein
MSFRLIDATVEELEAGLAAAGLEVLVEGDPLEIADYVSGHRNELSELAFIFHCKIKQGLGGYEVEWPEDLVDLVVKPASGVARRAARQGGATFVFRIQEGVQGGGK